MSEPTLQSLRESIDTIDQRIQTLINERAALAQRVAEVKQKDAAPQESVIYYRPEREAQVLRKVKARNQGPLSDDTVARMFREIMSACLALEEPMKIAYLGPEGTFTQAAAIKHFGHAVQTVPCNSIDDVFREVAAGSANYGVVPVENSTEGMVNRTLDSFIDSPLHICGEVELRIHHHLMVGANTKRDNVTRIYSHQQSLAQCRQWLDANYPSAERVAVNSNAEAARRLSDEWNAAAIAGETAAELYKLEKIAANIEDNPNNSTRFLIVGNQPAASSGSDKTSVLVSMRNRPGALLDLLTPFNTHGISLTRLETRPARSDKWAYVFFIDFEGHQDDPAVAKVFEAIEAEVGYLKRLGSYPKAVL